MAEGTTIYHVVPPGVFSSSNPQDWPRWKIRTSINTLSTTWEMKLIIFWGLSSCQRQLKRFILSSRRNSMITSLKKGTLFSREQSLTGTRRISWYFHHRSLCPCRPLWVWGSTWWDDSWSFGGRLTLSEKIQLMADLTLDKALVRVCQEEAVKKQQSVIQGCEWDEKLDVGAVQGRRLKPPQKFCQDQPCPWYGKFPGHDRQQWPAREVECRKCGKKGHFQHVCWSGAKQVSSVLVLLQVPCWAAPLLPCFEHLRCSAAFVVGRWSF